MVEGTRAPAGGGASGPAKAPAGQARTRLPLLLDS